MMVTIYAGGRTKGYQVDRLVLTTFRGEPPSPSHYCRHKDDDQRNCALSNLTWARRKYWGKRKRRPRLNRQIGRRIRGKREQLGLRQGDAAGLFGVSPSQWNGWETGRKGMRVQTLVEIAEILDCSPRELLPE